MPGQPCADVVVVCFSYRPGVLDLIHFGLLSEEMAEAVSFGFHDQVATLG